ncbi:MAG: ester cyclase [Pseudomonadota bacterium]
MSDPTPALRRQLHEGLMRIAEARPGGLRGALEAVYHPDAKLRGAAPIDDVHGIDGLEAAWGPIHAALPDCERRDVIFMGGAYEGRTFLGAVGHYCGTFQADLFGIPATGRTLYLRYGEMHEVEDGRIVRTSMLVDFLDAMRQADVWPLAPSLGVEEMWAAPITGDGLRYQAADPAEGAASLAQTLDMHGALGAYDDRLDSTREGLLAMPQRDYWHEKMMWYGPAGIGTTRGLAGFVDHHQLPFRLSLPNRRGGNHYVRIGDGPYSATGGWPSVYASHEGGVWLGLPTSGRELTMRVMDFYLHDEGLIRENWVPIDMIDILRQMDVDVFARMRALLKRV